MEEAGYSYSFTRWLCIESTRKGFSAENRKNGVDEVTTWQGS